MALSGEDRLIGAPLTPKPFEFGLVQVERAGESPIGWPTPCWRSFWHFDRLSFTWRGVVEEAKEKKRDRDFPEWMAFQWIWSIVDILLCPPKLDAEPKDRPEAAKPKDKLDWPALTKRVKNLEEKAENEEPETRAMIQDWLMHLAILLSSQLVVPTSTRRRFSSSLGAFWKKREKEIQRVRDNLQAKSSKKANESTAS
jgi:hypothetical protein